MQRTNSAIGGVVSGRFVVAVDRIKCDGHGVCADLLPEMIELDDWGYPIVLPGAVPSSVLPHARRAVSGCPTLALRLQALAARR